MRRWNIEKWSSKLEKRMSSREGFEVGYIKGNDPGEEYIDSGLIDERPPQH